MGACTHNGNSTEDREFDSNVFYFLNLTKDFLILFCTYFHLVLLSLCHGSWWVGKWRLHLGPRLSEVHPTNTQFVPLPMMGFEYINNLPPIHYGSFRPKVGIMAHLVEWPIDLVPLALKALPTHSVTLDPIHRESQVHVFDLFFLFLFYFIFFI